MNDNCINTSTVIMYNERIFLEVIMVTVTNQTLQAEID